VFLFCSACDEIQYFKGTATPCSSLSCPSSSPSSCSCCARPCCCCPQDLRSAKYEGYFLVISTSSVLCAWNWQDRMLSLLPTHTQTHTDTNLFIYICEQHGFGTNKDTKRRRTCSTKEQRQRGDGMVTGVGMGMGMGMVHGWWLLHLVAWPAENEGGSWWNLQLPQVFQPYIHHVHYVYKNVCIYPPPALHFATF